MKLQQVAPGQGSTWVRKAFQVFGRQPLGFASLFAAGLFASLVLGVIPVLGSIATLALAPAISLLFMIASRRVGAGEAAMPGAIVELFRAGRSRLIALVKLGLAYVVATFLLFWLASVLDGGALASFFSSMKDAKLTPEIAAARVAEPGVQFGLLLRLLFLGLLSIAFWHAPALVFWTTADGPSRFSSAPSRSGATKARSRSTRSSGSRSSWCCWRSSASARACSGPSASPSSPRR